MLIDASDARTIVGHLSDFAASGNSEQTFVSHLEYGAGTDGFTEHSESFRVLDERMRAAATRLRETGLEPGDRVMIVLPTGLEFIVAFLGALAARIVAVPVPLPGPPRAKVGHARLSAVIANSGATAVVAPSDQIVALRDATSELLAPDTRLTWLRPLDLERSGNLHELEQPGLDEIAYLQYTSGSTATPRGVIISHHNVVSNVRQITEMLGGHSDGTSVNWAPHYHDMGLMLSIFRPMLESRNTVVMSPTAFIERPARWLEAISKYGAVESCAPPFAYDLAARRVTDKQIAELDLSAWKHAIVGAEPIETRLLESFASRLAPAGFAGTAFSPGYGLAEATLAATFSPNGLNSVAVSADRLRLGSVEFAEPSKRTEALQIVSCGRPAHDIDVRIVDPKTLQETKQGDLGEIWIAGTNVARGYWIAPDATAEVFAASLHDHNSAVYLRTGDLGFLHEDELFIAGRLKDLIIIRGQNFFPQDLERTVTAVSPHIRPGCVAAFNIERSDGQALGIILEIGRSADVEFEKLIRSVRRALSESHAVAVSLIIVTEMNGLPKTSSGKLQRRLARQMEADGELMTLYRWAAPE